MTNKKTWYSFAWSFLEQGGSKAIQLIVQIVLARLLAPEAFGVLAILLVVVQVAEAIAQSGLGMALVQEENANDTSFSTAWWLSLGIAFVLYAAIFFAAPAVESFYQMPNLFNCLRVLGVVVFFNSANSIQRSHLQRTMSFKSIFYASTIATLVSGVLGIALAFADFGVWALVFQNLMQNVIIFIVMWIRLDWKPTFTFNIKEAKELFAYGWKVCVTAILNVFYNGISELIIGRACTPGDLGLFSQGRKYPQAAIGVMNNSIANVLFPVYSSIKNDPIELRRSITHGLKLGTFIVAPISFLAAVVAEPLVALLLTEKWLACVPIFQLMCIANAVLMMQLVNLRAYMALGDSALYMRLQIIKVLGGGAIIWATAFLTKDIYATAIANCAVVVLSVLFVDMAPAGRMHGYSALSQIKDAAPFFVLSFLSSLTATSVECLNLDYLPQLLVKCLVFCIVYLAGSKLLGFNEWSEAKSLMARLLHRREAK